jgi:hypothetical protein
MIRLSVYLPNEQLIQYSLFMLQAILFYIPRWLWKNWEGGKLQTLRMDLNIGFVSKEEKAQKKEMLVDYLQENLNNHTWWSGRYFLCEVLALINIIGAFTIPTPSRMNVWAYVCTYEGQVHIQTNHSNQYNYRLFGSYP